MTPFQTEGPICRDFSQITEIIIINQANNYGGGGGWTGLYWWAVFCSVIKRGDERIFSPPATPAFIGNVEPPLHCSGSEESNDWCGEVAASKLYEISDKYIGIEV